MRSLLLAACAVVLTALLLAGDARAGGPISLEVHASPSFTPLEREQIQIAALLLEAQTSGWLKTRVAFDDPLMRGVSLLRVAEGTSAPSMPANDPGMSLLAWVDRDTSRMFFIVSRFASAQQFEHAVMHELLHLVGVNHIQDPAALMWPTSRPDADVCIRRADAVAFCAKAGCVAEQLAYCR